MAFGEGSIGTESGIGQGLAYVLPQSRSEEYALQLAQNESKSLAATAAAKLKRQQDLADDLNKQFASQKLPNLWSPYNKIVSDNSMKWQQQAASYSASTGKSPFTNPELMNQYNTDVNGVAQQSKDLGDKYGKLYSAAVADAGNKYTIDSVKKVLDYEQEIKKDPVAALTKPLPELKLQPASFNDFAKLIEPVSVTKKTGTLDTVMPDRSKHIDQTLATLMSNPEKWGGMALAEFGLDLTKPTYPVVGSNGRKVYPTNQEALGAVADRILNGKDSGASELAQFGIPADDEFAKEKLVDAMKKQNQGIGKILTQTADLADAKVGTSTAVSDFDERLKLARESNSRAARSASKEGQDETVIYRKKLVDDMINGVAGSGETIKGIVEAKPEFVDKLKINIVGDKINFEIPDQVTTKVVDGKPKSEAIPGRRVTIDKKDSNAKSKMNQLINEITGENIPESKFQSGNAGGKIKTGVKSGGTSSSSSYKKSISRSLLSSKAADAGYSIAEYEKLLKERGVKIE